MTNQTTYLRDARNWIFLAFGILGAELFEVILVEGITGSNKIEFGTSGEMLLGVMVVAVIILLYGFKLAITTNEGC